MAVRITKEIVIEAKKIREQAAGKFNCPVAEIDWVSCVTMALRGEKIEVSNVEEIHTAFQGENYAAMGRLLRQALPTMTNKVSYNAGLGSVGQKDLAEWLDKKSTWSDKQLLAAFHILTGGVVSGTYLRFLVEKGIVPFRQYENVTIF